MSSTRREDTTYQDRKDERYDDQSDNRKHSYKSDERRHSTQRDSRIDSDREDNELHSSRGEDSVNDRKRQREDDNDEDQSGRKRSKREPISLEELLKQKKEQETQDQKPVFLTKAQRRELALKRRQEEVENWKKSVEEQRRQLAGDINGKPSRRYESWSSEEEVYNDVFDDERRKEIENIKMQKLGVKKEKKKLLKQSDKLKFVFDWDANEDTSKEAPPAVEVRPQFGRGFIAGIDKREQIMRYREIVSKTQQELAARAQADKERYDRQLELLERNDKRSKPWYEKKLSEMTQRDWRIFREEFKITTKGGGIPNPIRDWKEAPLPDWLFEAIKDAKYKRPTPIQMQAIPIGLQNRDIIGIAETGSGKTASFVIPMLVYISKLPPLTSENEAEGPYALILAPTRELAVQIDAETRKFCKYKGYRTVCLVGGADIQQQAFDLRRGCEIVVATPGRLVDCLESRYIVLNQCNYVVLDEADRMMEMGFEKELNTILDAMPKANLKSTNEEEAQRQENDRRNIWRTTIMYSATMPPSVERLAATYMRRPATIIIGEVGRAVDRITQTVEFVKNDNEKKRRLEDLLLHGPRPPIIVFANQKKNVDLLCKYIIKLGFRAAALHSGKTQEQREQALEDFKEGNVDVLVATDVAGRGLDVKGVTHVINYDMPKSIDDYTHRIGRTGRAGATGLATSFLTNEDTDIMYDLKQMLQKTNNIVPKELAEHPAAQVKPGLAAQARRETVIFAQ